MKYFISTANPLRLGGAAVPPELVLIARALAVALIVTRRMPSPRYLPYLELLDRLGSEPAFSTTLHGAAAVGFVLLLFTRFVRAGCFLAGVAYLIGLLAGRPYQSVALTFVACVFLIVSLSSHASGTRLFRAQVVILYLGAVTNKALDPDWWSGRYFETFMTDHYASAFYISVASALPPMALSRVFGVATMVTQVAIVALLLSRRFRVHGAVFAISFHGIMTLMAGHTFGPFLSAILLSLLAFFPWPARIGVTLGSSWAHRSLERFLMSTDFDGRIEVAASDSRHAIRVEMPGSRYDGFAALRALALAHPLFYFAGAVVLMLPWKQAFLVMVALLMLGAATVASAMLPARKAGSWRAQPTETLR